MLKSASKIAWHLAFRLRRTVTGWSASDGVGAPACRLPDGQGRQVGGPFFVIRTGPPHHKAEEPEGA